MEDPSVEKRREMLYRVLPEIYQSLDDGLVSDKERGPLRELLSVVGEQVNLLEDDLARWYNNWFIETCEDWVVPYIGDLVGYESAAKELNTEENPESPLNRAVVFPRREIADAIALRRRKGTLAVLEELSRRIVGWPARAVEYRRMTLGSASTKHLRVRRSSTVDLRNGKALAKLDTAFDELPRTVDVRRISSHRTQGRHNLPAVGLHVCRRKIDSATIVPAWVDDKNSERRTFDVQGLDIQLHILPEPELSAEHIARTENLPVPLTRSMLRRERDQSERLIHDRSTKIIGANTAFYGLGKSVFIVAKQNEEAEIVPADRIFVTDLSNWRYDPSEDECDIVALDPETGRIAFHPDYSIDAVWTTYHYGRPAWIGGGEYDRQSNAREAWRTVVKSSTEEERARDRRLIRKLIEAVYAWHEYIRSGNQESKYTLIEIADNDEHHAECHIKVPTGHTLEIRAANRFRPFLHVPDTSTQEAETCRFSGESGSRLILDGLHIGEGEFHFDGLFSSILIRHCTFTPGKTRMVFELNETDVQIEHSIVGEIVTRAPKTKQAKTKPEKANEQGLSCPPAYLEPIRLTLRDSLINGRRIDGYLRNRNRSGATDRELALSGSDPWAHAILSLARTTVFGEVDVHAVDRIEDSILFDRVCIENCMTGCLRFSYVAPESCTPPQFHCQPSLVMERAQKSAENSSSENDTSERLTPESERVRAKPQFVSVRYGHPDYARLSDDCAIEILQGASDEGEMGVYHNEFYTQRSIQLRQRLQEFVPAGNDIQIIFEN